MALKGLIDATLEQEAKIAALEKALAKLSNLPSDTKSEDSRDTKRELGVLKEWLKE